MATTSSVPRGCFSTRDWNGDIVIFDPKAPLTPACRVIVYLREDFRVRLVGTYIGDVINSRGGTIRFRRDGQQEGACLDFDRDIVEVAKVVRVDRKVDEQLMSRNAVIIDIPSVGARSAKRRSIR